MRIYHIPRSQMLAVPLDRAWTYFATPHNLETMTPAFLRFDITSDVPDQLYTGLIITYRIAAVAGVPLTWVSEIKDVRAPFRFVYEQRLGPFRFWHHLLRFSELEDGTRLEDIVYYVMPFGWLGQLAHRLFIRARLNAIFDFRRDYLARLWPSSAVFTHHD
jgi:ligand-binding SRPBCC domain-containing protein